MHSHKTTVQSILPTLLLAALTIIISCNEDDTSVEKTTISFPVEFSTPNTTNDGWSISSPETEGVDREELAHVDYLIKNDETLKDIQTLTIVRNGKLVFDEFYYSGEYDYKKGDITYLQSVTKSFASTFIGIAIDKGIINSVTDPVKLLLPNLSDLDWSNEKGDIKLEHILTMTAGLAGVDGGVDYADRDPEKVYDSLRAYDFGRHMFSKETETTPGTVFFYRTALTNTLRDILANAIGDYSTNTVPFIEEHFLQPLNINDYIFEFRNDQSQIHLGGGLSLPPRDAIKLGQLILDDGVWNGKRIVSSSWLTQATAIHINFQPRLWGFGDGYGYSFWHRTFQYKNSTIPSIIAAGSFGQYLVIFPTLDAVILITSQYPEGAPHPPIKLIEEQILKAIN
jgi:CubicO group peptidase (beta-lactamase class C family)